MSCCGHQWGWLRESLIPIKPAQGNGCHTNRKTAHEDPRARIVDTGITQSRRHVSVASMDIGKHESAHDAKSSFTQHPQTDHKPQAGGVPQHKIPACILGDGWFLLDCSYKVTSPHPPLPRHIQEDYRKNISPSNHTVGLWIWLFISRLKA